MDGDEQHEQAFGEHTGISCRTEINLIKNNERINDDDVFIVHREDADRFTYLAWELLGRYIANNTHLKYIDFDGAGLTDEKMSLLFRRLVRSESLIDLDLNNNSFGIEGVRSMIPLLQNCPRLSTLFMGSNDDINSECFELLINALNGTSVKVLYLQDNNIEDISALNRYILPNLHTLNLNGNKIGREGWITISNLLQKEGSTLTTLYIRNTDLGDEEAELLASSLNQNTKLEVLNLLGNNITERGCLAFFKLLNDVSSIENTYKSNHTLKTITIAEYVTSDLLDGISEACIENRTGSSPNSIGRLKVIRTQLKCQNRVKYCKLQGIQCPSNIFADIEPVLLPNILGLIGEIHGQSELYNALVPTAPDLLSYIDRKALLTDELSKTGDEYVRIKAKLSDLKKRLALLDEGDCKQPVVAEDKDVVLW